MSRARQRRLWERSQHQVDGEMEVRGASQEGRALPVTNNFVFPAPFFCSESKNGHFMPQRNSETTCYVEIIPEASQSLPILGSPVGWFHSRPWIGEKKECLVELNFLVTVYHFQGSILLFGYGLVQSYQKAAKVVLVDFMPNEKQVWSGVQRQCWGGCLLSQGVHSNLVKKKTNPCVCNTKDMCPGHFLIWASKTGLKAELQWVSDQWEEVLTNDITAWVINVPLPSPYIATSVCL